MRIAVLSTFLNLFISCLFLSCDSEPDTLLPELTVAGISQGEKLSNEVTLSIAASDNEGVSKVEFFLDDIMVSSLNKEPYTFTWNTLQSSDGDHTVKIVVTDNSGNRREEAVTVSINNALVKIDLGNYLLDGYKGYIVVTDLAGNVLYKKQFSNNEKLRPKPETSFTGENVNVYLVHHGNPYYHTSAYLNIKKGSYCDMTPKPVSGVQNPIKLRLKNTGTFDFLSYGTDYSSTTIRSINDTTITNFNYMTGGKIYAQVVSGDQGKYDFLDIEPNKASFDVDISLLSNVSKKQTITFPITTYGSFYLAGVGDEHSYFFLFQREFSGTNTSIYYPEIFDDYFQLLRYSIENRHYSYAKTGSIISDYPAFNVNATITSPYPSDFKLTFNGVFDHYSVDFESSSSPQFIHVYAPYYITEFQIPDFTSIIDVPKLNFYSFDRKYITLTDTEGMTQEQNKFDFDYALYPKGLLQKHVSIFFGH